MFLARGRGEGWKPRRWSVPAGSGPAGERGSRPFYRSARAGVYGRNETAFLKPPERLLKRKPGSSPPVPSAVTPINLPLPPSPPSRIGKSGKRRIPNVLQYNIVLSKIFWLPNDATRAVQQSQTFLFIYLFFFYANNREPAFDCFRVRSIRYAHWAKCHRKVCAGHRFKLFCSRAYSVVRKKKFVELSFGWSQKVENSPKT